MSGIAVAARPGTRATGRRGAFAAAYGVLRSRTTGVTLILAMALCTAIGTLVDQVPKSVAADPEAYAEWLARARETYGPATDILARLDVFRIFSSLWFLVTVTLLALGILASTAHRVPATWRRAVDQPIHHGVEFYTRAPAQFTRERALDPPAHAAELTAQLRRQRMRVTSSPSGSAVALYADRFRFAPLATTISHLSFVLILFGVALSATTGFADERVAVPVGESAALGHGTGLQLTVQSFADRYYPDGSPQDYASQVILSDATGAVAQQRVRVNQPLRYNGIAVNQSYFGTAAQLVLTDPSGQVLLASSVPMEWITNTGAAVFGQVRAGEIAAYVAAPVAGRTDSGIADGQVRIDLVRRSDGVALGTALLSPGKPAVIDGYRATLMRERAYSGFLVTRDPGRPWVWAGASLLIAGLFIGLFGSHRRLWIRVTPTESGSRADLVPGTNTMIGDRAWSRALFARLTPEPIPRSPNLTQGSPR